MQRAPSGGLCCLCGANAWIRNVKGVDSRSWHQKAVPATQPLTRANEDGKKGPCTIYCIFRTKCDAYCHETIHCMTLYNHSLLILIRTPLALYQRGTRKCHHRGSNPAPPCLESYAVTKYRAEKSVPIGDISHVYIPVLAEQRAPAVHPLLAR
jgi:hypothetical protein